MQNVKQVIIDMNKDGRVANIVFHHLDETVPLIIDYSGHPLDIRHVPAALAALFEQKEKVDGRNETKNNKAVVTKETSSDRRRGIT